MFIIFDYNVNLVDCKRETFFQMEFFCGQDVREPAVQAGFPAKEILGGFRRKRKRAGVHKRPEKNSREVRKVRKVLKIALRSLRSLRLNIIFGGLRPRPGSVFDHVTDCQRGVGQGGVKPPHSPRKRDTCVNCYFFRYSCASLPSSLTSTGATPSSGADASSVLSVSALM